MRINLAIFDLDNTLIAGDSDHAWGNFLANKGIVDKEYYAAQNQRFYNDYQSGKLDMAAYIAFSLKPLKENTLDDLYTWRNEFIETVVEPLMLPKAIRLLEQHREKNHTLLIITATNTFITAPIAARLGVEHLIGTEPEIVEQRYTGNIVGEPSFQAGKINRLKQWLDQQNAQAAETWFYSDSLNDLPLLKQVDHPVAVDPDATLAEYAKENHWDIISLR